VYKEGDVIRTEFLDEKVREKVIVARQVVHVHDFGRTPFGSDDTRGGGEDRHLNDGFGRREGGQGNLFFTVDGTRREAKETTVGANEIDDTCSD
jgi:hypothetical protein